MSEFYFNNLTAPNGAVQRIAELVFLKTLNPKRLGELFSVVTGLHNGDKAGLIGEFGKVGKKSVGCNPTYVAGSFTNVEKTWDLQEWQVALKICYNDLKSTLAKYDLKTATQIYDLSGLFMQKLFIPKLQEALQNMVMRLAWFGDKSAASVANGGSIKNASDVDFYNICDGFWKQIFTLATNDTTRRVTIAANQQTSFADQLAAIRVAGVATGIINDLIESADPVLRDTGSTGIIYMNLKTKDALDRDIRNNNKGSDLHWESIFGGIQKTDYNGVTLITLPFWDKVITGDEGVTGGAAWHLPFRAIYTIKDNMQVGTDAPDGVGDLDINPNKTTREMEIFSSASMGVMIPQDNLIQVAY